MFTTSIVAIRSNNRDLNNIQNLQLKAIILPLKLNSDCAMPTLKNKMIEAYMSCRNCTHALFDAVLVDVVDRGEKEDSDDAGGLEFKVTEDQV